MTDPTRVPVAELVDLARVGPGTRPPTPREIRAALPRGWALDDDGRTARRDLRLFFREGWILLAGLVVFGSVGAAFLFWSAPRGAGLARFAVALVLVLAAGGIVGPIVTRAVYGAWHPRATIRSARAGDAGSTSESSREGAGHRTHCRRSAMP